MVRRPDRGRPRISLRLFSTPAHAKQVEAGRRHQELRLAVLQVDLAKAPLPNFLLGISLPSVGIIREGLDAYTWDGLGRTVNDAEPMRSAQGLAQAASLVQVFGAKNHCRPIAWTGSGNTVQNRGCVAYIGASGELYRSVGEDENILRGYRYPGLVLYRDGKVRTSDVRFVPSGYPNRWKALVPRSDKVHLIVTGQRLVKDGKIQDPYRGIGGASSYPDKRHLIQNPYPKMSNANGTPAKDRNGNRIRRDFGLDQLSGDQDKYNDALRGCLVSLSFWMTDFDGTRYTVTPGNLRKALADKGYRERARKREVKTRGDYLIDEAAELLYVRFKMNSYPHHFVATRDGEPQILYDGVIGGWSNNGGTNPYDLALDLVESGFSNAILLDNGGDSVLCHKNNQEFPQPANATVPSCEERNEWAGVIVYHVTSDSPPDEAGISLAIAVKKRERGHYRFTAQF